MRYIILLLFSLLFLGPVYGQAPEKRFVGNCSFSSFSLVSDSTYRGNITRFDDRLGDGYNLTQLVVGYEILDGRGLVFEISTIHSSTNFTADVTVTAKVDRGFAPFGSGQVYNPTTNGLIPPSSQEQSGLSPTQKARIDRHNVVTMESLLTGADSVFSITYVSDTSSLTPIQGQAFINSTSDTLGLYNGVQWVMFFGGGAGDNLGDHILDQNLETDGFWLSRDGTSGEGIFLNIDGDVGIDEGTPQQDLHVQGTVRITDVSGTPSTITGRDGDGDIGNVALGNGLSLTSGTLNYVIDSTRIVQDSIVVYYQDGSEIGRDTIPVGNGGGGGSTDDQVASEVPITDAGGYYTGTEVEAALQEVGADMALRPTGSGIGDYVAKWGSANALTSGVLRDNSINVGINVAPSVALQTPLYIRRDQADKTQIYIYNSNTTSAGSARLVVNAGTVAGEWRTSFGTLSMDAWVTTNHALRFGTNDTEAGRFSAAGLFGVATTSPRWTIDNGGTDGTILGGGTTAQRGTGYNGGIRFNTTENLFGVYGNSDWHFLPWMNDGLTQLEAENYTWNIDQSTTGRDAYRMAYNETNDELELVPTALSTRGVLYETVTTGFTPLSGAWVRYAGFLSTALENFTATDSTLTYTGTETITAKVTYTGSLQLNPTSSGTYRVRLAVYENTVLQGASECDTQIVTDAAETWKLPVTGQTLVSLSTNDVISLKHIGDSSANPSFVTCYLLVEAL